MKIFVVIPAFNESKSIGKVIGGLRSKGYSNIVVVDDGSSDNTSVLSLRARAIVLRHIINRGQGAALRTGIDYALREGADIIVTFDSDGQHRVEDLPAMIRPVANGEVDVTLGSRFLRKTNMPFSRRLMLKAAILFQRAMYGVWMSDAHNGLRVLSKSAAQTISIESDRMEHASEIVEQIVHKKIRYKEVPVTIRYTNYSLQKGHASIVGALRILARLIIRKILI